MAVDAPNTGAYLRTPVENLEDVSTWFDAARAIIEMATEEPDKMKVDRALYGADRLIKHANIRLHEVIEDLIRKRGRCG